MKLSVALAAFPLPSCYRCVMGADEPQTAARRSASFVTLRLYSIKHSHLCSFSPFLSPFQSHTSSVPWSGGLTFTSSSGRLPWSSITWRRYRPCPRSRTALLKNSSFGICQCSNPKLGEDVSRPSAAKPRCLSQVFAHVCGDLYPPVGLSACSHPTNHRCEQTNNVNIKLRGKYGCFSVSYPDYS